MAFEEMSGPRTSDAPKQVFASFDERSSPAGFTSHRPSASLLKDTPPSIIVALSQLAPIVASLNTVLALITWTGKDNWSSFLLLATFWLTCLYGDVAFHYAGNWLLFLLLGIGYLRKKTKTQKIVHAIQKGADPLTQGIDDTQKIMDATLYEIDCLRARCHLLSSTFEPAYKVFTWEDPKRSALIGMRLMMVTPIYIAALWLFSSRALLIIVGTFGLVFTSPWFKVVCTVCWRLRFVRKVATAAIGIEYFPGESNIMQILSRQPAASPFEMSNETPVSVSAGGSRFTTTISVVENQRRWLGLGWTASLLPHERAPFTDIDDHPGVAPENTALPEPKTIAEDTGISRTITWKWIDSDWRIEKERGRDTEGWLYFDNTWHHPSAIEGIGKYTRRRKWIRNAECSEVVFGSAPDPTILKKFPRDQDDQDQDENRERKSSRTRAFTIDPEKVTSSVKSPIPPPVYGKEKEKETQKVQASDATELPKAEWRQLSGGGRELITSNNMTLKKRPFTLRRKSSRGSNRSVGVT